MRNIYNILEFNIIRDNLQNYTKTEIGLERVRSLAIIQDKTRLEYELKILDEAMSASLRYGSVPVRNSNNLYQMLDLAYKGGILTPRDFYLISDDIASISDIYNYFKKIKVNYPLCGEKVEQFFDLSTLRNRIEKIIAPDLSVKDNASEDLSRIRKNIRRLEAELTNRINVELLRNKEYVSDSSITMRDECYVLPIQTIYKNKVPGIVRDISDSGQTTFIEPSSVVELSNDIYIQKKKEYEEIKKILKDLTSEMVSHKEEIISNNKLIGYFDFVFAKANYAIETKSWVSNISSDGSLIIKGGRHPLIDPKKVVANSFSLNLDNRMLLISGPNAGGKTVSIKTLGLFALMNQSGLALPTQEISTLPYFNDIFVDIGDSQSITDNLSTFSGHVRNLVYILENVKEGDLVLLDEIGTGTSPKEGESLAYAVIRTLLRKRCYSMISSHFEGLKAFALSNKHIQNASMIFDEKRLLPTYILQVGVPGKSYGLALAKRYKMNDDVLLLASNYLKNEETDYLNEALDKLNEELANTRKLKDKEKLLAIDLENKNKELEKAKKNYERKLKEIEETFELEKEKIIEETKKEVDEVIKTLSNPNVKLHEVISAKARLEKKLELDEETENSEENISIGSYVEISDTEMLGKVTKINGNNVSIITSEGMNVTTKLAKLRLSNNPIKPKRMSQKEIIILKPISSEINLIGLHIDEALVKLDHYLDDAVLHHMHEVRIIHGMGTGRLRTAIHEYLKKQNFVKEFAYAPINLGSTGATIVKLK